MNLGHRAHLRQNRIKNHVQPMPENRPYPNKNGFELQAPDFEFIEIAFDRIEMKKGGNRFRPYVS
jgi:hypothetical protein